MSDNLWSVGQVAKRCGINVSALHFYERKGLIQSVRNTGNQRRYRKEVVRRVSLIKAAQNMGISLAEIKQQLATLPLHEAPSQQQWRDLSRQWRVMLNQRIKNLEKLGGLLDGCIGCGCLSMKACPLYNQNDVLAKDGPGPVILNRKNPAKQRKFR